MGHVSSVTQAEIIRKLEPFGHTLALTAEKSMASTPLSRHGRLLDSIID